MDQDQVVVVPQDSQVPDSLTVDPNQQAVSLAAHFNSHTSLQEVVLARQAPMQGGDATDPTTATYNYAQAEMVALPQSGVGNSLLSLYHSSPNVSTAGVKSEDFITTPPNKKRKSSSSTQMYLVEQILKLYFKKSKPETKKMISMLSVKQVYLYVLRNYLHLVVPINTWGRLIRNVFEINKTIPKVKGEQVIHGWRFKGWEKIVKRDKQTLDAIKEMLNIQDLDEEYSYFKIVDLSHVKNVQVNPWPYAKSIFDVPGRAEELSEKDEIEEGSGSGAGGGVGVGVGVGVGIVPTGNIEPDSIRASLKKINENMLIIGSCLEYIKSETDSIHAKLDAASKQPQQQQQSQSQAQTSYSSDQ